MADLSNLLEGQALCHEARPLILGPQHEGVHGPASDKNHRS